MRYVKSVRSLRCIGSLAIGVVLATAHAAPGAAPAPPSVEQAGPTVPSERADGSFDAIIAHIGEAVDSGKWTSPGINQATGLDGALAATIEQIKGATRRDDLAVPIELADVEADEGDPVGKR